LQLKTPASTQASRHSPVRRHQPPGHLRHAPPGRPGRRPGVAQPTGRRGQAASLVAAQGAPVSPEHYAAASRPGAGQ